MLLSSTSALVAARATLILGIVAVVLFRSILDASWQFLSATPTSGCTGVGAEVATGQCRASLQRGGPVR